MFDIPQEYKDAAQQSLRGSSDSLPCPYPAPLMYWRNGDPALASIADIKTALRFGGWGIDREAMSKIENLPPQAPNTWILHDSLVSKANGSVYDAYLTRKAHVAPVVRRWRWNAYKNVSEVEYLCFLAEWDAAKKFAPWGWVLLTARSRDTKVLDSAFREFETRSEKARQGTPINYFYVVIGTLGDAPKFESRQGKDGKSSQVTPMQLYVPKDGFTVDALKPAFVGQEVAADIYVALNDPAVKAWVESWKKQEKKQDTDTFGQNPY